MKRTNAWVTGRLIALERFATMAGISLAMCAGLASATAAVAETELLEAEKAFQVTARRVGDNTVELRYTIASGYYMYRDRFRFSINGKLLLLTKNAWPPGKLKDDATFGRVVTYRNSVRLLLSASTKLAESTNLGLESLTLTAASQGCADAGVCYPPLRQTLVLPPGSSAWIDPQEAVVSGFSKDRPQSSGLADRLSGGK